MGLEDKLRDMFPSIEDDMRSLFDKKASVVKTKTKLPKKPSFKFIYISLKLKVISAIAAVSLFFSLTNFNEIKTYINLNSAYINLNHKQSYKKSVPKFKQLSSFELSLKSYDIDFDLDDYKYLRKHDALFQDALYISKGPEMIFENHKSLDYILHFNRAEQTVTLYERDGGIGTSADTVVICGYPDDLSFSDGGYIKTVNIYDGAPYFKYAMSMGHYCLIVSEKSRIPPEPHDRVMRLDDGLIKVIFNHIKNSNTMVEISDNYDFRPYNNSLLPDSIYM